MQFQVDWMIIENGFHYMSTVEDIWTTSPCMVTTMWYAITIDISVQIMYVVLFYFALLFAEYISASAHDELVTNSCQSIIAKPKYDGKCNCFQQLLEIRCDGLTYVPQFSGFNCVFVGVYMANQSIRQLEANAFAHLPTRRLVLDFNDIEDRLHAAAFSGNLSEIIQELYLGACRLHYLPSGLFDDMHNLNVLHLWHNNIKKIPAELFISCGNMRELILSHNDIVSLDVNTFIGLRNLRKLDLDCNKISVLSREIFNGLSNLQVCIF